MVIYIYISHRKLCAFSKDKSKQNLLPTWQLKLSGVQRVSLF